MKKNNRSGKQEAKLSAAISGIHASLDRIEEMLSWRIYAASRFHVGQRVEFSRKAFRRGITDRKRSHVGFVKKIEGFGITVRLVGYKTARSYHHSFFNPVRGPKLF